MVGYARQLTLCVSVRDYLYGSFSLIFGAFKFWFFLQAVIIP